MPTHLPTYQRWGAASYRYLLAAQLALAQWPGSLLGAAVGWTVGYLWRNETWPAALIVEGARLGCGDAAPLT